MAMVIEVKYVGPVLSLTYNNELKFRDPIVKCCNKPARR